METDNDNDAAYKAVFLPAACRVAAKVRGGQWRFVARTAKNRVFIPPTI